MLARIVGAHSSEIGIMNSLSVNLQLLLSMFYRPKSGKYKIVMERNAFPSDHYVVQSCIQVAASLLMAADKQETFDVNDAILFLPGKDPLAAGESTDTPTSNICIPDTTLYNTPEILDFIEEHARNIALILLPGVQYLTGQAFDIESVTRKAHQHVK